MSTVSRRVFIASGLALTAGPARAAAPAWYSDGTGGFAADGADVVAYRGLDADARGVAGDAAHQTEWNGAKWRFVSAENLATFRADPESYAPRFGGYCAWAVSKGYTAHGDKDAWHIHDGHLYLNYSRGVRRRWRRDIPGNISLAEGNWPAVLNA